MVDAYIIRRGETFAVQMVEQDKDYGNEREVGWFEGLTREEAITQAKDRRIQRCDD